VSDISSEDRPSVAGAVLAGGSSRRMGRDKAFIRRGGTTMVERAAAAMIGGGVGQVVVVGGDLDRVSDLGLVGVADRYPGAGPLGAIITALEHLRADIVVVLACDHLDPDPEAVRTIIAAVGAYDAVVPVSDGTEQWLHSAWRSVVLPKLVGAYDRGARAPRELATELTVNRLTGGDPSWYRDADQPADLSDVD
jgi:molybdenum cofactor guanylyltransferase